MNLVCGNSLRRTARVLGIDLKTVTRKMHFLAGVIRNQKEKRIAALALIPPHFRKVVEVDFDEMESSIVSKLLPVTIPLAVDRATREILSFHVDTIPAKGHLSEISRKKYGPRENRSEEALQRMMDDLKNVVNSHAHFRSDQKSTYASLVKDNFPDATHTLEKSRRAAVVGYGELKQKGYDPLFAVNHTAAMIRYSVARLARRTWCTSKTMKGLLAHMELYVHFHNTHVIAA